MTNDYCGEETDSENRSLGSPFPATDDDHPGEECGVFAVYGHPEASKLIYLGLYALQHRGQEGAGIVCSLDGKLTAHRGVGLVADVFKPHKLERVVGNIGIGHVRYSTFGSSNLRNVQPLVVDYARGSMAVAWQPTNAAFCEIWKSAPSFSPTDSEVIIISSPLQGIVSDVLLSAAPGGERLFRGHYQRRRHRIAGPLVPAPGWAPKYPGVASEPAPWTSLRSEYAKWNRASGYHQRDGIHSVNPRHAVPNSACSVRLCRAQQLPQQGGGQVRRTGRELARQAPTDADIVWRADSTTRPPGYSMNQDTRWWDLSAIITWAAPSSSRAAHPRFGVKIKLNPRISWRQASYGR